MTQKETMNCGNNGPRKPSSRFEEGASACSRWSMWDYGTHWLINTDNAHIEAYGITKDQAEDITEILNANAEAQSH